MNEILAVSILVPPLLVLTLFSVAWWFGRPLSERWTTHLVTGAFALSGVQSLVLLSQDFSVLAQPGTWFSVGHYTSVWQFSADPLALIFAFNSNSVGGWVSL